MSEATERLRELLAAATPGPWAHSKVLPGHAYHRGHDVLVGNPREIDLAVAMHTALPDLLDAADELERLREAAGEFLAAYDSDCPDWWPPERHDLRAILATTDAKGGGSDGE